MKVRDTNVYWTLFSEMPIPVNDYETSHKLSKFLEYHSSQQTFYACIDDNTAMYVFAQMPEYRHRAGEWDINVRDVKFPREATVVRIGCVQIGWCWEGEAETTLHSVTKAQLEEFAKRIPI